MPFPRFHGFVRIFVFACTVVFVLQIFATYSPVPNLHTSLIQFLGLTPEMVFQGMIFQPLSWIFLHRDPFHLIFNMFGIWMFGAAIQDRWGSGRFAWFCLWCGFLTGLIICLASLLPFESTQASYTIPTIGASGVVFGILMATSRLDPNSLVLFFFVFPMKMRWFAYLMIALEFYALYTSNQHGVSNLAHLSGALVGYLLTPLWNNSRPSSRGGGQDWFQELKDRIHQRRMRKKIRIIRVNDRDRGPTFH